MTSSHLVLYGGSLAVAIAWGVAPVAQKVLLTSLPFETVFALGTAMYAAGAAAFTLLIPRNRRTVVNSLPRVTGRHIALLVVASLIGGFAANLLFLRVLQDNSSFVVTAMTYAAPVFTLALAATLLSEPVHWVNIAGVLAVAAGVSMVSWQSAARDISPFVER